jgi:hypothetical protein
MFLTEAPFWLRILHSHRTWKLVKWVSVVGVVWFAFHSFNLNYQFVNSNGIHGVVAKNTLEAIAADSVKARSYDTIPDNYYNLPVSRGGYPDME